MERQQARLLDVYVAGVIEREEFERKREEVRKSQEGLRKQLRQLEVQAQQHVDTAKLAEGLEAFCARVAGSLDDLSFEQRRKLVELLIDCVIVGDGMVEIRYVVPTSSKGEEVPFCHLHSNYLCFVGMPRATGSPFAFSPQFVRHKWSEAAFPISGRFVRELKAAFQEHFGEVTKAQSVTNAPQDDQQHDVGGKFKIVEGRARPLIEGPMAVMAAKHAIAELGLPREMGRRGRRAMRTWHLRLLNM